MPSVAPSVNLLSGGTNRSHPLQSAPLLESNLVFRIAPAWKSARIVVINCRFPLYLTEVLPWRRWHRWPAIVAIRKVIAKCADVLHGSNFMRITRGGE